MNFLRCLLFLIVILLDPKVITLYCLCFGSACIMTPLLSQRLGWLPSMFCIKTQSPSCRGGSSFVCWSSLSWSFADLGASASSLQSATDFQTSDRSLWDLMWAVGFAGMKSRNCLPSNVCAGESPVSGSGVLRSWRSPLIRLTVSSSPDIFTESLMSLFALPTDLSAFWLA